MIDRLKREDESEEESEEESEKEAKIASIEIKVKPVIEKNKTQIQSSNNVKISNQVNLKEKESKTHLKKEKASLSSEDYNIKKVAPKNKVQMKKG